MDNSSDPQTSSDSPFPSTEKSINQTIINVQMIFVLLIIIILFINQPLIVISIASLIVNVYLLMPSIQKSWQQNKNNSAGVEDTTENFSINENPLPYGEERAAYTGGYSLAYPEIRPISSLGPEEETQNIDNANTMMARARMREKKAIDGALVKDVNYYKYHYADELSYEENKPWWGREDY